MEPQPENFDVIIIGGGPAGLSASIYAVRKSLKVLLITKVLGGQAALSSGVENYLGYTLIKGTDLADKFREEVNRFSEDGLKVKEGEEVVAIGGTEGDFTVKTDGGVYKSKTIIIASGRVPKMLGIPGEKEFLGRGVSTCATCDAPFYKGKTVAVIGGGNSALDAAFSLIKIAKAVIIINVNEVLKGDVVLAKNVLSNVNVQVLNYSEATQIIGSQKVEGVRVKNKLDNSEKVVECDGVFVEIGWMPSAIFDKLTKKNDLGEIVVDEFGKTSIEGIWAAGDVNSLWGEQIIIAAGEGAKVALSVAEHISKIPHQPTSNIHYT